MATKARSALVRRTKSVKTAMVGEQPGAQRKAARAVNVAKKARSQGRSKGTITATERKSIRLAGRAVKATTTAGEAKGVKAQLRRKAKRA